MNQKVTLTITGMTCAACSARLEKVLNKQPHVTAIVNLATEQAHIEYAPEFYTERSVLLAALLKRVEQAGFHATESTQDNLFEIDEKAADHAQQQMRRDQIEIGLSLLFCLPFWIQMLTMFLTQSMFLSPWLEALCAAPVQFYFGRKFHSGAYRTLKGGGANMDVLVSLGTNISYFYSLYFVWLNPVGHHALYFEASVTVISLVLFGKYLENRAKQQTHAALSELIALQPKTAHVFRHQEWNDIPVNFIRQDDIFLVRQGEAIPVDGEILEGTVQCNEQFLTGEPLPVLKSVGETLLSGSVLVEGTVQARATQVGQQTVLAQMIHLVRQAQGSKAPIQRLADRVSGIFVPIVVLISLATFLGWWGLAQNMNQGIQNALAVLVIACPCALGLATPTAMMVATGLGAKQGLIAHNVAALEQASQLDMLFLDKTGTLTQGTPEVKHCFIIDHTLSEETILNLCAQLEHYSVHPLAKAIVHYVEKKYPNWRASPESVSHFKNQIGQGVTGCLDQQTFCLGAPHWIRTFLSIPLEIEKSIQLYEQQGETVLLALNLTTKKLLLGLSLADTIRSNSQKAIHALTALGIRPIMLTGDQAKAADAIAQQIGLPDVIAQVSPQEKYTHIQAAQKAGHLVGMVGDGLNDAAALAQAHVSFAMGGGTDLASQNADITLMRNDLMQVVATIWLSRKTLQIIRQNLFFAFVYNTLGILLAIFGIFNPTIAGAAMAMSSLSVVSNSLRLRHQHFDF